MKDRLAFMLRVVADENIGFVPALLAGQADVTTLPGRAITREHLARADALVIRAVTPVNEALLAGTPVKFVGTTTSGFDHVDRDWLEAQGISFTYAPGSNATSVAEYAAAALLELAMRMGGALEGKTIGIIGAGHTGSRAAAKARALGLRVLLNDPPLRDATADDRYRTLEEVLAAADIISLHVPLTTGGPYPTHRMVNAEFLARMKPGAWFINASRGPVADEAALKSVLRSGRIAAAVLDVWDSEPEPDLELIRLAALATPHIAGYSYNGKIQAVRQVAGALATQFDLSLNWNLLDEALPQLTLPWPQIESAGANAGAPNPLPILHQLVCGDVYPIANDDTAFRQAMLDDTSPNRGARFDALRKHYPRRYEYSTYRIEAPSAKSHESLLLTLHSLGFGLSIGFNQSQI